MAKLNDVHMWQISTRKPDTTNNSGAMSQIAATHAKNVTTATQGAIDRISLSGKHSDNKWEKWGNFVKVAGGAIVGAMRDHNANMKELEHQKKLEEIERARLAKEQATETQLLSQARTAANVELGRSLGNRYIADSQKAYYGTRGEDGSFTAGIVNTQFQAGDGNGNGSVTRQGTYIENYNNWVEQNKVKEYDTEVLQAFEETVSKHVQNVLKDASDRDAIDRETFIAESRSTAIGNKVAEVFSQQDSELNARFFDLSIDNMVNKLKAIAPSALYEQTRLNNMQLAVDYDGALLDGLEDMSNLFDLERSTFDNPILNQNEEAQKFYEEKEKQFISACFLSQVMTMLQTGCTNDVQGVYENTIDIAQSSKLPLTDGDKKTLEKAVVEAQKVRAEYLKNRTQRDGMVALELSDKHINNWFSRIQQPNDNTTLNDIHKETDMGINSVIDFLSEKNELDIQMGRESIFPLLERGALDTKTGQASLERLGSFVATLIAREKTIAYNTAYGKFDPNVYEYDNVRKDIAESVEQANARIDDILKTLATHPNKLVQLVSIKSTEAMPDVITTLNNGETNNDVFKRLKYECENDAYLSATGENIYVNPNKLHLDIEKERMLGRITTDQATELMRIAVEKKPKLTETELREIDAQLIRFVGDEKKYRKIVDAMNKNKVNDYDDIKHYPDEDFLGKDIKLSRKDANNKKVVMTYEDIMAFRVAAMEYAKSQDLHKIFPSIDEWFKHLTTTDPQFINIKNKSRIKYFETQTLEEWKRVRKAWGTDSRSTVFGSIGQDVNTTFNN